MIDVLGLGDAGIDLITQVPRIPKHDEKILAYGFERHTGGVVANFLCALAKFGAKCGFVGLLGNDEFGRQIINTFEKYGIDLSNLTIKEGEETYFCISMLDNSGEKALVIYPTSTIFPKPDDISKEMFKDARLLHTTGLYADTALRAFKFAKECNMVISLDLEPSTLAQGCDLGVELISQVDILFLNTHACDLLYPGGEPELAGKELIRLGPKIIVLTRGENGSIAVTADQVVITPAFSVPVVDTTGAGDCFNAAFIYGYLKNWPLEYLLRFANAAGAISVTGFGAQAVQPTVTQIEEFLTTSRLPHF